MADTDSGLPSERELELETLSANATSRYPPSPTSAPLDNVIIQRLKLLQAENDELYDLLRASESARAREEVIGLRKVINRLETSLADAEAKITDLTPNKLDHQSNPSTLSNNNNPGGPPPQTNAGLPRLPGAQAPPRADRANARENGTATETVIVRESGTGTGIEIGSVTGIGTGIETGIEQAGTPDRPTLVQEASSEGGGRNGSDSGAGGGAGAGGRNGNDRGRNGSGVGRGGGGGGGGQNRNNGQTGDRGLVQRLGL
ncbi:pre-mRNA-splicing factor 38-associated hydrophilic carboxy-terminal protein [Ceratobasidium sp. AG-Ba]|nr:pre-mRNA-splicing factor 38-associated hydrophilic carboxy-terminal protein [Ceratobasidium sp. AG-Ba]